MTYIFLTPELGNMGGSQMFVCNKSAYLSSKGWRVVIIYFTNTKIIINKLNDFEKYYVPELAWGIQYYTPRQVRKIMANLVEIVKNDDSETVIESSLFHLSFWGELLASKIKAKHILHFLEEDIPTFTSRVSAFMEYKLRRWECMNASEKSLKRLFKSFYKKEFKQYEFRTDFFCSNVFPERKNKEYELNAEQADDTILSIGRLDKPYIQEMVNQIIVYANKYNNRKINLILIGGSPDGKIERTIKEQFSRVSNVRLYLLGYLFPVPSSIVKNANVTIATSNSVLVSYNMGVVTIAVDAEDFCAIGLYGIDTFQTVFRKDENKIPISTCLERVLIKKDFICPVITNSNMNEEDVLDEHFKDQMSFLLRSNVDGSYYNINKVFTVSENIRGLLVRLYMNLRN